MILIRSQLTESVRDTMTPETGSNTVTKWGRSNFIFEIQAFHIKTGAGRKTYDDPITNLNCVSACNQSEIVAE